MIFASFTCNTANHYYLMRKPAFNTIRAVSDIISSITKFLCVKSYFHYNLTFVNCFPRE